MSILLQFEKLPYPAADCTGKTFIVIGANVGIGKEAVRHFVRLNASKVILGVRSIERGEAAKADIEATTKRTEVGVMEVWEIDLSRYASVKSFASKVATLPRVDAVVSNASIATTDWEVFEGHESTITVNVISTMLLVLLLLPTMRASAEKFDIVPIVDVVCSDIHHWSPFRERNAPNIFAEISDKNRADMSIERLVNPQIPTSGEPLT
jgi:retinol dehydrogenase-12